MELDEGNISEAGEGTAAAEALAEAQAAKGVAERQTRLAEQANRRVQELEQELLQLEEHVAGLEDELNKSQSQVSKFVSEKLLLKEQVATLERDLSASKLEEKGGKKNFGRCKTDGIRDHDSAQEGRLHAEMLLETTKREHEEVLRAKDAESEEQRICMATLQEQHLQLQQYCVDLRSASQEIQGFLERAETENAELLREVEEMREVLEAHHLDKAKHEKRNSAQVDFFITGSASLAEELEALEVEEKEEVQTSKEGAKDDADIATSETPGPARRKKPMLRRSSSSVAASKLAALQEEYEEKFEDQSQQLQTAILNKERIERDKQEAINALQKQIEELKGKLPAEKGGDALAGLFQMMSKIKELATEASDAVLLGFLPPERRNNAGPASSAGSAAPVPKAEALKFSSVASSAAVRSRLQGRRQKKAENQS